MSTILPIDDNGLPTNASSYVSLSYANSYHSARRNDEWLVPDSVIAQENALINASYEIDQMYGQYYASTLLTQEQVFLFPRVPFKDTNGRVIAGIPSALKNAVCEWANLIFSEGENMLENDTNEGIKRIKTGIGREAVLEEIEYWSSEAARRDPRFDIIKTILSPLLVSTGSRQGRVSRG